MLCVFTGWSKQGPTQHLHKINFFSQKVSNPWHSNTRTDASEEAEKSGSYLVSNTVTTHSHTASVHSAMPTEPTAGQFVSPSAPSPGLLLLCCRHAVLLSSAQMGTEPTLTADYKLPVQRAHAHTCTHTCTHICKAIFVSTLHSFPLIPTVCPAWRPSLTTICLTLTLN